MPKALTPIAIQNLKARAERYEVSDGTTGLRVVVFPSRKKSFIVRYRYKGLQRKLTLGACLFERVVADDKPPEIGMPLTLKEARELCTKALREAESGKEDPAAAKQKKRQEEKAAESDTLQAIQDLYLKKVAPGLRSFKQRKADLTLICTTDDGLGRLRVGEIKRSQYTKMLDGIEERNGAARAYRCRSALRTLLNWHTERSDDFVSPLARGGGPRAVAARERVLTDDELRAVWRAASEDTGLFGKYLQFVVLTATRRGEAAGLRRRSELSEDGKLWTIPGARYKNGKDHAVPLSKAAQAIIATMPARGDFVFSAAGSKPLSDFNERKKAFDKACGVTGWRIHDLRRSARTLLSKCPSVTPDVAERCLGHVIPGVRAVYDRHKYLDEMLHAFEALAALVERIVHPPGDVVVTMPAKSARK